MKTEHLARALFSTKEKGTSFLRSLTTHGMLGEVFERRSLLDSTLALPSTDFFMKQSIEVNIVVRPTN